MRDRVLPYSLVGAIGVSIHAALIFLGTSFFSKPTIGFIVGFIVANVWAYCANSYFTFYRPMNVTTFTRYWVVIGIAMCLSTAVFAVFSNFSALFASMLSIPMGVLLQFVLHNKFTFREDFKK